MTIARQITLTYIMQGLAIVLMVTSAIFFVHPASTTSHTIQGVCFLANAALFIAEFPIRRRLRYAEQIKKAPAEAGAS